MRSGFYRYVFSFPLPFFQRYRAFIPLADGSILQQRSVLEAPFRPSPCFFFPSLLRANHSSSSRLLRPLRFLNDLNSRSIESFYILDFLRIPPPFYISFVVLLGSDINLLLDRSEAIVRSWSFPIPRLLQIPLTEVRGPPTTLPSFILWSFPLCHALLWGHDSDSFPELFSFFFRLTPPL